MNPSEAEFRRVESRLDALVRDAEQELHSEDVRLEERSARTYHYKNEYLLWSHSFLKEWRVDVESARITIGITYSEPLDAGAAPGIEFTWRAELFQQGHESRIDERGGFTRPLRDVEQQGMASLIKGAISECTAYLPRAL